MQAFDRIGIQVELKDLVIHIRQGLHVAFRLRGLSDLVPGGDIHADALEFLRPFLIHGLGDPAENIDPRSVAAEQRHLPGNGRVCGVNPVQVFGKPAAFLHRNHLEDIALVHFQIVQFPLPHRRAAQDIYHLLVDIGDPGLLFAGIFHKPAGNGFIQELQVAVFFFQVADISQHGSSSKDTVLRFPG